MSQSVFHINHTDSTLNNEVRSCYEALSNYNIFCHQYDGAGSHLVQTIAHALQGTIYQKLAEECFKTFNEVCLARQKLQCFEQLKTMEAELVMLKGHIDAGNQTDLSKIYAQSFFHILLQFIKMQDSYFNLCHKKMAHIVSQLIPQSTDENNHAEVHDLDGKATCDTSASKQNHALTSNSSPKTNKTQSPKHQNQGNLKSSFFSLFERKSAPPREKQSALFYVDVQENCLDNKGLSQPTPSISCDDLSSQSASSNSVEKKNNVPIDIATEEDIDSVINLLSGMGCQSSNSTMHVIPENQVQLTVPPIYRLPSPASDSHIDDLKPPHFQMHRHSDGSVDLSAMQKTIWNPPHRGSLPGVGVRSSADINLTGAFNKRYLQDIHPPFMTNTSYVPIVNQLWSGPTWLTPSQNNNHNNTWPYYNPGNSQGRSETLNSSWSGIQDSSDLSDDSSCGEQFFAVGQDLVHALDSKEYSSDDESKGMGDKCYRGEPKSSNTWPPPPPDSTRDILIHGPPDEDQIIHRPIQMQWSDPMSTHSMWPSNPPGVQPQRQSQSMQGFSLYQ